VVEIVTQFPIPAALIEKIINKLTWRAWRASDYHSVWQIAGLPFTARGGFPTEDFRILRFEREGAWSWEVIQDKRAAQLNISPSPLGISTKIGIFEHTIFEGDHQAFDEDMVLATLLL
jgi:hypothetical protein